MYRKWDFMNVFGIGGCIGCIAFIYIYGVKILNVQYDAWLLVGGDLTQQYLGWCFYRNSDCLFPFGLTTELTYPYPISIVYADPIPLLAVFFKLLSPILPTPFQYHGLWGLVCFLLQGGFSAIFLYRYVNNKLMCGFLSLFFICSSIVFQRMYGHTPLASHWIIIVALCCLVYWEKFIGKKKSIFIWGGLGVISVCVHAYFVPITFLILLCYSYNIWVKGENVKFVIYTVSLYLICVFTSMYLLGALQTGFGMMAGDGLGHYSSNLNSLFNARGYSKILSGLPIKDGQNEGEAYLGAGMLIVSMLAMILAIYNFNTTKGKIIVNKTYRHYFFSVLVLMVTFFFLAVAPKIAFGNNVILNFIYPQFIEKILSLFRATGRFMFPVLYMIMLFSIAIIVNKINRKLAYSFLFICLMIQMYDFSGLMQGRHSYYKNPVTPSILLKGEHDFGEIIKSYNHIIFVNHDQVLKKTDLGLAIAYYAQKNQIPISAFYLARMPEALLNQDEARYIKKLQEGNVSEEDLFVFLKEDDVKERYQINLYHISGFFIGSKNPIDGLKKYNANK